ncbi:MAG: hypothetical protein XXXJIFNMEKO3_01563 [Candidatus Erwinia impunctatus]|nr:hypothetical protein XXXJIFNMEKO_01563 [Culicoides impunctatus]
METKQLSEKWQKSFAFFEKYGAPATAEHKAAYKALPFTQRSLITFNFFAFFFGIIYFLILGLWKKGLMIFAVSIGIEIVFIFIEVITGYQFPNSLSFGITMATILMYCVTANYAYYLKEVKGSDSWNTFEGLF